MALWDGMGEGDSGSPTSTGFLYCPTSWNTNYKSTECVRQEPIKPAWFSKQIPVVTLASHSLMAVPVQVGPCSKPEAFGARDLAG